MWNKSNHLFVFFFFFSFNQLKMMMRMRILIMIIMMFGMMMLRTEMMIMMLIISFHLVRYCVLCCCIWNKFEVVWWCSYLFFCRLWVWKAADTNAVDISVLSVALFCSGFCLRISFFGQSASQPAKQPTNYPNQPFFQPAIYPSIHWCIFCLLLVVCFWLFLLFFNFVVCLSASIHQSVSVCVFVFERVCLSCW